MAGKFSRPQWHHHGSQQTLSGTKPFHVRRSTDISGQLRLCVAGGRGRRFGGDMSRLLDGFIGGWTTNGVWRLRAGRPLVPQTADGTSLPTYGTQRPNLIGTPKRNHGHDWIDNFFTNPQVFVLPPIYAISTTPRTIAFGSHPLLL